MLGQTIQLVNSFVGGMILMTTKTNEIMKRAFEEGDCLASGTMHTTVYMKVPAQLMTTTVLTSAADYVYFIWLAGRKMPLF